jgi:hypothetical protein
LTTVRTTDSIEQAVQLMRATCAMIRA